MNMSLKKAFDVVSKATKRYQREHFAFGNNLFLKGFEDYRHKKDHESYEEITEALAKIEEALKDGTTQS